MRMHAGERFVVFANSAEQGAVRVVEDLLESFFGGGMITGGPPARDPANDCPSPAMPFPTLQARQVALISAHHGLHGLFCVPVTAFPAQPVNLTASRIHAC